jgi:hypothetical protein
MSNPFVGASDGRSAPAFTPKDARNAGRHYQHLSAVINRLLYRIMEGMEEATAKRVFKSSVFATIHSLHGFFNGRDLAKKELMVSHQFVVPHFNYHGDPKHSAKFMDRRLDALAEAEAACGRRFIGVKRADNQTQLFTWYQSHPLLDAAEWAYLQARNSPDYAKNPAKAITTELLDAAIAKLPEVKAVKRTAAASEDEERERWASADVTAGAAVKGRWTKIFNAAERALRAEFDAGSDPLLAAQAAAAKIIEMGKDIKARLAQERLRAFSEAGDEDEAAPASGPKVSTAEILAEVFAAPRAVADASGRDSVSPAEGGAGADTLDKNVAGSAAGAGDCLNETHAFAVAFARQGLAVLPLWGCSGGVCHCRKGAAEHPIGKHPHGRLAPNGVYSATTDEKVIRRWFEKDPRINIGLAMGGPLNLVCVDVDPRNEGDATLYDLEEAHGPGAFPLTFEQITGGGGWHKLYKLPEIIKPKTGELKGKLGPGVDIKGAGGYIVAAPSMHASGRRYEVGVNEYIAEAPAWIVRSVRKAAAGERPEKVVNFQAHRDRKRAGAGGPAIVEGERNERLFKVGCALWGKGEVSGRDELAARLMEANHERVSPPLDAAEINRIVGSISSRYPLGVPVQGYCYKG